MATIDITAPNFERNLTSGFTQAEFITFLKDCFSTCGFTNLTESAGDNPKYLVYDLSFGAGTYDRVAFIVHIPTFTTGSTFDVSTGLCNFGNYNFTTFRYTSNHINAGGGVTSSNATPSSRSHFTLDSNNGYTAYNFPLLTTELKGVFIKTTGGDVLSASLGIAISETVFDIVNDYNYIMLCSEDFIDRFINTSNVDSNELLTLPYPTVSTESSSISNFGANNSNFVGPNVILNASNRDTNLLTAQNGNFQILNMPLLYTYYGSGATAAWCGFGAFSNDLVMIFGQADVGDTLIVTAGVEEYFVIAKCLGATSNTNAIALAGVRIT